MLSNLHLVPNLPVRYVTNITISNVYHTTNGVTSREIFTKLTRSNLPGMYVVGALVHNPWYLLKFTNDC
jgi:hypothetical protein